MIIIKHNINIIINTNDTNTDTIIIPTLKTITVIIRRPSCLGEGGRRMCGFAMCTE